MPMTSIAIKEEREENERPARASAFLSVGLRPFFLMAALWSALAVPAWLAAYFHGYALSGALPAMLWHAHEMTFGYGFAVVGGFLLTAIPNWTGRLPVRGAPLAALAATWLAGRAAMLCAALIGPAAAAAAELAFPALFAAVVARELVAGRNWRNLPMLAALSLLFLGDLLVHLQALGLAYTAGAGNRLGVAVLLALIALVGGRIVPSFTRNWLAKARRDLAPPAAPDKLDAVALVVTLCGLAAWTLAPDAAITPWMEIAAGLAAAARLSRWRGLSTLREPLVFVLHAGYGWLALGLVLLGASGVHPLVTPSGALHALTTGAIGTMTLAVMTRASLGHTGRALRADGATLAIYSLVTLAAVSRVCAALSGAPASLLTSLAGLAWTLAFATFAVHYGRFLLSTSKSNQ